MATVTLKIERGDNFIAETSFPESPDFRLSGINSSGLASELNGSSQVGDFLTNSGAQSGDLLHVRIIGERRWIAVVEPGLLFTSQGTADIDR